MISLRDVVTGFGNRDPLAEVWRRDLRGGGSSAEITGTLPLYFSSRGKPLTDYLISGNTIQDGTPTPEAPVDVVGCGVRTENLIKNDGVSVEYRGIKYTVNADKSITVFGTATPSVSYFIFAGDGAATNSINNYSTPIFKAGETLVFSSNSQTPINARYTDGTYSSTEFRMNVPITLKKDIGLLYIQIFSGYSVNATVFPMANTGSTALPYEPYGYKLPLTVNGTEYPIFLGQVPTTRRIRKLVLTGEENITSGHLDSNIFNVPVNDYLKASIISSICTHYKAQKNVVGWDRVQDKKACFYIGSAADFLQLYIRDSSYSTISDFKSYLAAQYANGTPVTVWYVLAEPETGIVNEPLMKIGDYADTISFAQAGVTIPTVSGANALDTTSAVKPSEVYIKGKGIKPTNNPNFENGG